MDSERFIIRDRKDTDYVSNARILNRLYPGNPITPEDLKHEAEALRSPEIFAARRTVEECATHSVVATGVVCNAPWSYDPDWYWINLQVDPDHQRLGVGRRLFDHLEGVVVARAAKGLWGGVRSEDLRPLKFFERSGFCERHRVWTSELDLQAVPEGFTVRVDGTERAESVEITSMAAEEFDRPEVRERVYRLYMESSRDAPRIGPFTEISFTRFCSDVLASPRVFPEGILLAKVEGEYAAVTMFSPIPGRPDAIHVDYTGTSRSYRKRGLATMLKARTNEFARSHGYRYVRTDNDSTNTAIWKINARIGFHPKETWIFGEKLLSPSREVSH